MPIERFFNPLRAAILAVSAKCGAGGSLTGGMHISPEIVQAIFLAAACNESVGIAGRDAGLLRFLAGIELDEQLRLPVLGFDLLG